MKNFIYTLPKNILSCFKGYWIWHIVAITLTFILVTTNIDWYYFINTRSTLLVYLSLPAAILGGLLPIIVPIYLILRGKIIKNFILENTGWAIGQAAVIGSIISSFYKFFSGRIQPNIHDVTNNISHNFEFGFFRHGIFWGWPSSHTTVAFAMAFSLILLFPKNKLLKISSFLYALCIGIGVSFSIHWLSDFVAGAIIGTIIGIVVAGSYKKTAFVSEQERETCA